MKIMFKPDITAWTCEFTCHICSSKLQVHYTDLKYRIERKWYSDGGFDEGYYSNVDYYYVVCPVCTKETQLQPNDKDVNIPYLLQEKAKKDYDESTEKSRHQ